MATCKTIDIPILILAAGRSSRMRGRDKLLETIDNRPLVRRQADLARAVTSGPVLVTLPPENPERQKALEGAGIEIVSVPFAGSGMAASLRAGIKALPDTAQALLILLADLPEITHSDIEKVCARIELSSETLIWRGATETGAPGHPIVFSSKLFDALCLLKGDMGGTAIAALHSNQTTLVRLPGQRARRDLDTPEDWAAWRSEQ